MSKISFEYGKALYELASEYSEENDYLSEIRMIKQIIDSEPELITVLSSPIIPKEERTKIIDKVFSGTFKNYICSFMKILTERGKAKLILPCFEEFEAIWYQKSGIVIAEAESATKLTSQQISDLLSSLEAKTGASVELRTSVIPSLIGGIRVKINGELIDGSVKGRLEAMKEQISNKSYNTQGG